MRVRIFSFLLSILFSYGGISQDTLSLRIHDAANKDQHELLNKYLPGKGDIESGIRELITLAKADYAEKRTMDALYKIQIALILEKQLTQPAMVTFDLNDYAGDLIQVINVRYALDFYKKATSILKEVEVPVSMKFKLFTTRAGLYARIMEYDSAIFYFQKAIVEARQDSKTAEASSFNNLGVFYQKSGQTDSAGFYFHKALDMTGANDIVLYCAVKDNLAQLSISDGDYKSALKTFMFNDSVYFSRNQPKRYVINKARLLSTMSALGSPGMEKIMDELLPYIHENMVSIDQKELLNYYLFAYDWYFRKGDISKQALYHENYISLNKLLEKNTASEVDVLTTTLLNVQESSFANELKSHILNAEKSRLKLKTATLLGIISVISAVLIISLMILYIRKRGQEYESNKKIIATELKNKEMEARIIQQELELKKRDLTNIVLHNTQVYDSNQKMIGRLQDIAQQKKDIEQQVRSLLVELQSQNQVSERSIGIQANIESVNAEFHEKLKQRFPDLTKAESELCGFIRINLSSKDISILKNVEASSVKMGKNRLRKKLGLDPEDDIYDFIRKI